MQVPKLPSPEEFLSWEAHPVTRVVKAYLRIAQESIKDQWASGAFQHDDPTTTQSANLSAMAGIRQIDDLINLDYDQLKGTLSDEDDDKTDLGKVKP